MNKNEIKVDSFKEFNKTIYYIIAKTEEDCFTLRLTKSKLQRLQKQIDKVIYSKCTKFDKNVKDTIEALKKNCENCLKVNKKCLIKEWFKNENFRIRASENLWRYATTKHAELLNDLSLESRLQSVKVRSC